MPQSADEIQIQTHAGVRELGKSTWEALTNQTTPPFLRYEWLEALEVAGCVSAEAGWMPLFISLRQGEEILAAAPAYVKGHSMGEFVFDHAWANFAEQRLGISYYPKLIVAVPFTPATGARLLFRTDLAAALIPELRAVFAEGLRQVAEQLSFSSVHVLFSSEEEATQLAEAGLGHRYGVQYHWQNANYGCFDDYLGRFNAKRRHQLKREIRLLEEDGVTLRTYTGRDIVPSVVDHAYALYLDTVRKYVWGRQYLNRRFFEIVAEAMPELLHVVLAHDRDGAVLGGAFNLLGHDALYGRYWGATREQRYLHFNVCYYHGVRECIQRGLARFEPGAGGEHKLARGFEPTITHSTHFLRDKRLESAIFDFLGRERQAIDHELGPARGASVPATAPRST